MEGTCEYIKQDINFIITINTIFDNNNIPYDKILKNYMIVIYYYQNLNEFKQIETVITRNG